MFGIRFSRPCHGDLGLIICVLALALTLEVASASKSQGSLKAERPHRGQDEGRLFLRSSFARMRRSAEHHGQEHWHTGATELENASTYQLKDANILVDRGKFLVFISRS